MSSETALETFLDSRAPLGEGDTLLIAFSGGGDSTALLAAASDLAARRGVGLEAAHLDHALDSGSAGRCLEARRIATRLGVAFHAERLAARAGRATRGVEAWARQCRYRFLERRRREIGARWVATAHHRDDQIETVLLRLLLGSGVEGLSGIEPRRGRLIRPLLEVGRDTLRSELGRRGLTAVEDPTNRDMERPRNLIREALRRHLAADCADLDARLLGIARAARRLAVRLDRRLTSDLELARDRRCASIDLDAFARLPPALRPFALATLHRAAGRPYPAGAAARGELERQLDAHRSGSERLGCDCGGGWRWEERAGRLELRRRETATPRFAYTLPVPGAVEIPELRLRLSIGREESAAWWFEGRPERAALALPLGAGGRLTVRNRRPGDRIRPLGCDYERRLKEVLIDRAIPRQDRDRLPLLCEGGRIAWVPGVTIDERYRVTAEVSAWVARLEAL